MRRLLYKYRLPAAALAFTIGWFALLAERPLYEPDEGRYAEIPREMLHGGDWIIPHLDGLAYIEKPPLQYWICAFILRELGETEGAARLCTGLAGYITLWLVFWIGKRLWGLRAGLTAAALTAASTLFFLLGHQLTLDMTLTCCLLGTLTCFVEAQLRRADARAAGAWMIACWAAMALAVLAKGLIGALIPGATLAIYALWQRDGDLVRSLRWVRGGAVFTALALPWFALAARRNPQFLRFFFIREHLQRFLTPIEHRSEHWWFFVPILLLGTLPWVAQALRALATAWRGASRREPAQPEPARTAAAARGLPRRIDFDAGRLLWIWTVFVLVFFSCSDAKLIPYILPAIPTLALLCADPLAGEHRGDVWIGACGSLAAAAGMLAYAVGAIGPPSGLPLARTLAPILVWTSAGLGLSVALAIGLLLRAQARTALGVLCAGWLWTTGTVLVGADRAAHFFSAKYVARLLEAQPGAAASAQPGVVPPGAAPPGVAPPAPPGRLVPVFCVQTYEQSLPFYLRRTVILVDYRDELDFGLRADPDAGIGSVAAFASRWRGLEAGYAVMPFGTHTRLAREGLPMRVLGRLQDLIVVSRR